MSDESRDLFLVQREMNRARKEYQEEHMKDYMDNVYTPAQQAAGKYDIKLAMNRIRKVQEAMKDYDRDVYYPALMKLKKDCTAEGHHATEKNYRCWNFNVVGWQYYSCPVCCTPIRIWGDAHAELKVIDGDIVHDADGNLVMADGSIQILQKDEDEV